MTSNRMPNRATLLAQAGHFIDAATRGVVPPIHNSTTFARDENYALVGPSSYARGGTPAWDEVEALLAALDGGEAAMVFASGLAAATAVFEPLRSGQHVVAPRIMYHGLQDWLRRLAEVRGIGLTLVDPTNLAEVEAAMRPGETAILWIETLLNPTWDVVNIAACADIAHKAGARLGVDATVTPPVTCRPIEHGADIVFHSATKYLNGHSDVMGGALISTKADDHWAEIKQVRLLVGGVMGPFEAWLLLRGMRTLEVLYARAAANAMAIATHLNDHPALSHVLYPGLPSHPGHETAARQMEGGFGAMLSLRTKGGEAAANRIVRNVKAFLPATSLGGVESLIEHRFVVEGFHSEVPCDLLRISVGIESVDDLIADLDQALDSL
ncbi:MAG: aminotransferase class I/II-fold pyridoxal phosphate-dependent enzyme [Pseudomonadota bacterium]